MEELRKNRRRRQAIQELIENNSIEDQATLVSMIKKTYNIDANQSIICKDLRALGISKQKSNNAMIYELPTIDSSREILRLAIVDIVHNESLIVIKTVPGLAAFVADFLDMQEDSPVLGTIAGENTIFITPTITKEIKTTFNWIRTLLYIKEVPQK